MKISIKLSAAILVMLLLASCAGSTAEQKKNPLTLEDHFQLAFEAAERGNLKEAISEYKKVLKMDSKYASAHLNLGVIFGRQGKWKKEISQYKKTIDINPNLTEAYFNLGVAYGEQGKSDEAIRYYEKALQTNPKHVEALNNLGVLYLKRGKLDEALSQYKKTLEVQLPQDAMLISGVEDKLNQLFDNLLTNAIKYNRQGGKIRVTLSQDPQFAFTRIEDTGIGISHQSLKEVFTRHFQEKKKPLGDVKGLGIGLSLVQEIVKLHGGEVHLESELGKGTTFIVKLPKK